MTIVTVQKPTKRRQMPRKPAQTDPNSRSLAHAMVAIYGEYRRNGDNLEGIGPVVRLFDLSDQAKHVEALRTFARIKNARDVEQWVSINGAPFAAGGHFFQRFAPIDACIKCAASYRWLLKLHAAVADAEAPDISALESWCQKKIAGRQRAMLIIRDRVLDALRYPDANQYPDLTSDISKLAEQIDDAINKRANGEEITATQKLLLPVYDTLLAESNKTYRITFKPLAGEIDQFDGVKTSQFSLPQEDLIVLEYPQPDWEKQPERHLVWAAKSYLQSVLDHLLQGIQPTLEWRQDTQGNWDLVSSFRIQTLWQAMALQFFHLVGGTSTLRKCRKPDCPEMGSWRKNKKACCEAHETWCRRHLGALYRIGRRK